MTNAQILETFRLNKTSANNWRRRRHEDWTENYTLYRDKVILNRLTQRQSVYLPLMKYSIKTLLKDVDDAPILYFHSVDNDEQAEVFYNEYWKYQMDRSKLVVKDIIDKKQVLLYGRSFKKLNIVDGHIFIEILHPQDVLVDRFIDPSDSDTARFMIHEHIYKPLSSLSLNAFYDKQAIKRLQVKYATNAGLLKAEDNQNEYMERQKAMSQMGVPDIMTPVLGEAYVELNEYYIKQFDDALGKDRIWVYTIADEEELLSKTPQDELIGKTSDDYWQDHYLLSTWGDDTERSDFWSDGVADTLRTPNKVLNSWFSQIIENRTLRNYGMNYYNSSTEGFTPQTFTPVPWGWYPVPGNPKDVVQNIQVPDLSDSLEEVQFLMQIAEKASAATTFQQGEASPQQLTLGEVNILVSNASERIKAMALFYTQAWEDFGHKYIKLLEAAPDLLNDVTVHKKGRLGKKIYTKTLTPTDWQTKNGYKVEVTMLSEKKADDEQALQWLNAARTSMPQNQPLDEIYQKKLLENANLNSDEINQVIEYQKQMTEQLQNQQMGQMPQTRPPQEMINYQDLPPQGQVQMAQQAGIQLSQPAQPQLPGAAPMQQPGMQQAPMQLSAGGAK